MELLLKNISLVVVAADHNPTILNPDFLRVRNIVPEDWELQESPITTSAFSKVSFQNKLSIVIEPNKLQFNQDVDEGELDEGVLQSVATTYIKNLPHPKFTGVGVNFTVVSPCGSPSQFIKSRFISSGPWDQEKNPLTTVGLRFVYSFDACRLTLSVDPAEMPISPEGDEVSEIVAFRANFHRDVSEYPAENKVIDIFKGIQEDWVNCKSIISDVIS